jgi:hypothetical protein
MLSVLENDCLTCIYHETKEFTSIDTVLPLIKTQQYCLQIGQYITDFQGTPRAAPTYNGWKTSHWMCVVRPKRVYFEIPGIG